MSIAWLILLHPLLGPRESGLGITATSRANTRAMYNVGDGVSMSSVGDDAPDVGPTSYERQHVDPADIAREPVEKSLAKDDGEEHSDLGGDLDTIWTNRWRNRKTRWIIAEVSESESTRNVGTRRRSAGGYVGDDEKAKEDVRGWRRTWMSTDITLDADKNDNSTFTRIGLRKLLKGHQAFQTDRNRALAKSRQPDFKPPPESVREEILKHYNMWQSD